MSESARWTDVRAKARAIDPAWDGDERRASPTVAVRRVAGRRRMRERMVASVSGANSPPSGGSAA